MEDQNKDKHPHPKAWLMPSVAALVFLIVFSFFASISHRVIISRTGYLADVLPRVLVDLTNNNRLASNLGQLKPSPALEEAARRKAVDMVEKGYFAHYSPEGLSPWHFMTSVNYDFLYAGENLAVYFSDSEDVEEAWMNSPSHRENILNQNFTEIGIATAKGFYKGEETIFVVQMFGRPNVALAMDVADTSSEQLIKSEPASASTPTPLAIAGTESDPEVLGIASVDSGDQKFLAVENVNNSLKQDEMVVGESISYKTYSNPTELLLSSPSMLLTIIYIALIVVVIFLVLTALFFELRHHHYLHILCGFGLLVLILIMYFVYKSFFGGTLEIASVES
ncbi:MAG: CAP domain-containing protein [Patescibacteria group bacterium]